MNSISNRPIIAITMGDPAGIGPEILVKTLIDPKIHSICRPVVIGDRAILEKAVGLINASLTITSIDHPDRYSTAPNQINLINRSDLDPGVTELGDPTPETGRAMEKYILAGVELAQKGDVQAIVTCPITKTGLKKAGSRFHGHTELIAHATKTSNYAMMMAGQTLKVVLVTIHIPLSEVCITLTQESILRIIGLTHDALRSRFGIPNPRLAVAGLNPHAGEETMFGSEEKTLILPAVNKARARGLQIQGPLPPDTVFYQGVKGRYDAVICMYHDQGLIPFKLVHFEDGVNTTLGLPIIRTSVDHGTAYDIAWKGIANPESMKEAVKMAVFQAVNRQDRPDE